jgi:GT2 family glycosyltransferase
MAVVQYHPLSRPAAPRVSVCIANFNGEAMLADCIDSVLAQDTSAEVEVLVHDDASSDRSLDVLRHRYPQVSILASSDNVGFCVANNRMAAAARGEFLLLLNNDAALAPDAIRSFLASAGAIATPAIFTCPQYDWENGRLVDRGCLLDPFYNPVPNLDPRHNDVAYVIGACLWCQRTLWGELGGFPEWFGSIAEDIYLCSVARLRGFAVRCIDGSGYRHRQGASFGGNRAEGGLRSTYGRRALSERNKTAVMLVCTPGWTVWPLLSAHLALLYVEGALLSTLRRDLRLWREVYLPVLPGIVATHSRWMPLRRRIQADRSMSLRNWWLSFTWMPRKLSLLWRHGMPRIT